jgi:filamentous hemagglutinin
LKTRKNISVAESAQWRSGGSYRQIATALTAAAGGNVTGGTNQLIQGAAVNYIQSLGATEVKKIADSLDSESARAALHGILACGGEAAQGTDCGNAALGASAGSVINSLMAGDPSRMTAAEKDSRKNLVATLVTGIAAAAGSNNVASATNAATIETENNALFLHNGFVVARDKQDDNKVVKLNDKDAKKLQVIGGDNAGAFVIPVVADNTIENLNGSAVYNLSNPKDFNTLKEGIDMGYYPLDANGNLFSSIRIYFQNGMKNNYKEAESTASLIAAITGVQVGRIANNTHGIADDTNEYLKLPQTKDVLNEFTYRKLDQSGVPTLIVMHSAGNNDALQALRLGNLYDHQYPNLSFYSLGSPIGNSTLNQIISNTGGTYLGQTNDWRDPVTYSKTAGGGIIGATGAGMYYGAVYGCGAAAAGLLLGCIAGGAVGVVAGGAVGASLTAVPSIFGITTYHPMTNYLSKPEVVNTLQQWQSNNKP